MYGLLLNLFIWGIYGFGGYFLYRHSTEAGLQFVIPFVVMILTACLLVGIWEKNRDDVVETYYNCMGIGIGLMIVYAISVLFVEHSGGTFPSMDAFGNVSILLCAIILIFFFALYKKVELLTPVFWSINFGLWLASLPLGITSAIFMGIYLGVWHILMCGRIISEEDVTESARRMGKDLRVFSRKKREQAAYEETAGQRWVEWMIVGFMAIVVEVLFGAIVYFAGYKLHWKPVAEYARPVVEYVQTIGDDKTSSQTPSQSSNKSSVKSGLKSNVKPAVKQKQSSVKKNAGKKKSSVKKRTNSKKSSAKRRKTSKKK